MLVNQLREANAVMTLAEWMDIEMDRRETSMTKFADDHGLSHSTMSRMMNGKTKPDYTTLASWAEALSVDICMLIGLLVPDRVRFDAEAYAFGQTFIQLTREDRMAVLGLIDRLSQQDKDE